MAKVSINIVTWNGMRYLPEALESIEKQDFKDYSIVIVDNGSTDGTVDYIRNNYPNITLIRNVNNLGFARGHNQAMRLTLDKWTNSSADLEKCYVLVTNQDILLKPDFLSQLIADADSHPEAGSLGGKLYRAYFNPSEDGFDETVKSDTLDSTGLIVYKSRRVIDRGAGELDQRQYDQDREVFGLSGAILLVRAGALNSIRYRDEYFDSDFFSYKEDIDLAWRLRLHGWQARYVPEAVAHHYRGVCSPAKEGWWHRIKARKNRPFFINFHSYVNHYCLLLKSSYIRNLIIHYPWIKLYELKKTIAIFIFNPKVFWKGFFKLIKLYPAMKQKRKFNLSTAKVSPKEMRQWFQ